MRFLAGLLVLLGITVIWYLGYKALTFDDARKALAAFFKLPASPSALFGHPGGPAGVPGQIESNVPGETIGRGIHGQGNPA